MDQAYLKATLENSESIFEFILKLKTIPRAGWKKKAGIISPESVADHAYSVAAIAMMLSDAKNLNTGKILKMAILHDLAESIVGDLTPEDASKSKKRQLEDSAMKEILSLFDAKTRKQYWHIWMQYQKNSSKEAKLLHDIDKLEMALQAQVYSKLYKRQRLEMFFDSAKKQITDPDIKKILERIS